MSVHTILSAGLLGDMALSKEGNGLARLNFKHKLEDTQYLFNCINRLERYPEFVQFGDGFLQDCTVQNPKNGETYKSLEAVSLKNEFLTDMYHLWYPNGKKVLPREYVTEHLNEICLAIWYQDDGCLKNDSRINLATQGFEQEDNEFLRELLERRFHIKCTVDTQNTIDISSRRHVELFLSYVRNELSIDMLRKNNADYYSAIHQKALMILWKKDYTLSSRCKFTVPVEVYNRIEMLGSVVLDSVLRRKIKKELVKAEDPTYRQMRIIEAVKRQNDTAFNACQQVVLTDVSVFVDEGLDVLKQLTGITRNEYITALLLEDDPEIDRYTVVQLGEMTGVSRTSINNFIKKVPEHFPFEKLRNRKYYGPSALLKIEALKPHKYARIDKIREVLAAK